MSYVNPALRDQFESLPIRVKNRILERGARINTPQELLAALESLRSGGEPPNA